MTATSEATTEAGEDPRVSLGWGVQTGIALLGLMGLMRLRAGERGTVWLAGRAPVNILGALALLGCFRRSLVGRGRILLTLGPLLVLLILLRLDGLLARGGQRRASFLVVAVKRLLLLL